MLYQFLTWLNQLFDIPGFGVFQYLTFRAVLAAIFSLGLCLLLGNKIIDFLKRKSIGETIRHEGPQHHFSKAGTPTMGGIMIILAIIIPTLLWANLSNAYVLLLLVGTLWMGVIGFLDDYIKVFKKNKQGLKGSFKIYGQVGLGLIVGLTMVLHPHFQGLEPKIDSNMVIYPNSILQKSGFKPGDKLLAVDGKTIHSIPQGYQNPLYSIYTIERKGQRMNLIIPREDRLKVSEFLFGTQQYGFATSTNVPFFKNYTFNYDYLAFWDKPNGIWGKIIYVLVIIFIVTAVSNGVNITDGLDGLAAGVTGIVAVTLGIMAYVSGNVVFANYLNISFIPMSGEVFIFCAALIGACVGFLWYNAFPAQVFMGDTGSLALGGAVAVLALIIKKELLIPIFCGVYFVENLSVILQVAYFKYTKKKYGEGKRIFLMAPIHHHFEKQGIHESKIVIRFWIVTVLLCIITFATLKLR
jgi:phospho-N-acetylmuramoyl-pentapeptide-transferase